MKLLVFLIVAIVVGATQNALHRHRLPLLLRANDVADLLTRVPAACAATPVIIFCFACFSGGRNCVDKAKKVG
jgi:hypothetical protein